MSEREDMQSSIDGLAEWKASALAAQKDAWNWQEHWRMEMGIRAYNACR
jgi:hypothetical protein